VGYPSLEGTLDMLRGLARAGARAVELGVPFSDPIADGPEIQRASEWALRHHVGPEQTLDLVAAFRRESELPVVVMTYVNPVLRHGVEKFALQARAAGVDGVLLSDLPPDESPEVWRALDEAELDTVMLVAPTTDEARMPRLIARCRGFLYCLARTGVTGRSAAAARPAGPGALTERIAVLRRFTKLPIAVGFGISSASDAAALRGTADAVIVGAAFMRAISEDPDRDSGARVLALAGEMLAALHSGSR
jgi:tryptophan synthase alpha chain